jgi:hypothetical protein
MATERDWEPFGIPADQYGEPARSSGPTWQDFGLPPGVDGRDVTSATISGNGRTISFISRGPRWPFRRRHGRAGEGESGPDRAVRWLRNAMIALGGLAAAAAVVSFAAQFNMIVSVRHDRVIAALEAGIPDAAAAIFASLGIALALHGRRAIRARLLNVGAVATSIFMNFIAADPGWKNAAIWIMPPVAYALASDTAIGVIRSWTIARAREMREDLADDEVTPLAVVGALCLWLLRLALAPASTAAGFRRWVVDECPVAPGRKALAGGDRKALPAYGDERKRSRRGGDRGRGPGRRNWDALTPAYQARLSGAGISREAYEAGASLDAARGHHSGGAS